MKRVLQKIWDKRRAIGTYLLITVVLGTVLAVVQDRLKDWAKGWLTDTSAHITLSSSSFAAFPSQHSLEVMELVVYDISASDLVKGIKITAIFGRLTQIIRHHVLYSVDIEGFDALLPQPNQLVLSLKHEIDVKRKVTVYILTKRIAASREDVKLELPEIHVEGTDKNGKVVYR